MLRPYLRQIPLEHAFPMRPGECYCAMLTGQWDAMLRAAYEIGFILLELDENGKPVAAYQRVVSESGGSW